MPAITGSGVLPQTVSPLGDTSDLPALRFEVGADQSSVTWTDEEKREHESRGDDAAVEPEFTCVDAGDYSGLPGACSSRQRQHGKPPASSSAPADPAPLHPVEPRPCSGVRSET